MPEDRMTIEDEALDWVIRLRDPGFANWEEFEAWMSVAPDHADAYHAMAIAEQDIAEILATPGPKPLIVNTPAPVMPRRSRRGWLGGAVAASLAVVTGYAVVSTRADPYQVETQPGERRSVTLADGSTIALNGGTRLTLDRRDPRLATLDRGEAVFTVAHDDADPFEVKVGDDRLVDVGTRFNVVRADGRTEVQVAEGAVVYNPRAEAVRLDAGHSLRVMDGDAAVQLGAVAPGDVASWREGRLIYDGQTMTEVAAQLTRYTGQTVRAAPEVAERRFRGILSLGDRNDVADLAPILGVKVRRSGSGWVLAPL